MGAWDSKEACEKGALRLLKAEANLGKAHLCFQADVWTLAHEEEVERWAREHP